MTERTQAAEFREADEDLRWSGVANVALGAFTVAVPFVTSVTGLPVWINVVAGLVIIALGVFDVREAMHHEPEKTMWPSIALALLGVGLIAYPLYLLVPRTFQWTTVIIGVLLLSFALFDVWVSASERKTARHGTA